MNRTILSKLLQYPPDIFRSPISYTCSWSSSNSESINFSKNNGNFSRQPGIDGRAKPIRDTSIYRVSLFSEEKKNIRCLYKNIDVYSINQFLVIFRRRKNRSRPPNTIEYFIILRKRLHRPEGNFKKSHEVCSLLANIKFGVHLNMLVCSSKHSSVCPSA